MQVDGANLLPTGQQVAVHDRNSSGTDENIQHESAEYGLDITDDVIQDYVVSDEDDEEFAAPPQLEPRGSKKSHRSSEKGKKADVTEKKSKHSRQRIPVHGSGVRKTESKNSARRKNGR